MDCSSRKYRRLGRHEEENTYGSIFGGLGCTTLESEAAAFTLKPLRCDEALDFGSFGVWLFALAFRLHFAADDEFTDLHVKINISFRFFMIDEIQESINDSKPTRKHCL